jgi:hypothetical protein
MRVSKISIHYLNKKIRPPPRSQLQMLSSTLFFANAQKGVEVGAVAVKLASTATLFATTVRDNHAPTPPHKKT